MGYFLRFIQIIYSLYAFVVFVIIMLLLFPVIVIASFFGRISGGNAIYNICRFWADVCMLLWGMRHRNYFETPHDTSHPAVFVFNHISYIDIPVLMKTFRNQHIRVLGKAEMAKIPVFGFIYKRSAVLVQRDSSVKRARSVITLKAILKKNISIVLAPEGTFNMTEKPLAAFYDGAFRIAIETQTPIKPVLFLDTFDRLNYKSIFSLTPGKSRSVFLEEIAVSGYTISNVNELKEKVYGIMEAALIRYHASWIKDKSRS